MNTNVPMSGPEADVSYRLERSTSGATFQPLHPGVLQTAAYSDMEPRVGARYRLIAVNGLGDKYVLAETGAPRPPQELAASPLPYRGGELRIDFAAAGALGGGPAPTTVSLYDVGGRLVRQLENGPFDAGYHVTVWDGRDRSGSLVRSGVYFLRTQSLGQERAMKITVLR